MPNIHQLNQKQSTTPEKIYLILDFFISLTNWKQLPFKYVRLKKNTHMLKKNWSLIRSGFNKIVFLLYLMVKNTLYGRHQLSQPMRIVGPIQFFI